jgi:hypothetical protein
MKYVQPDICHRVPIQGGELILSPAYDVVHFFPQIGGVMLKYWNSEGNGMSNVLMTPEMGYALADSCGLSIVERPFIMATEHEQLINWQTQSLKEGDFGL